MQILALCTSMEILVANGDESRAKLRSTMEVNEHAHCLALLLWNLSKEAYHSLSISTRQSTSMCMCVCVCVCVCAPSVGLHACLLLRVSMGGAWAKQTWESKHFFCDSLVKGLLQLLQCVPCARKHVESGGILSLPLWQLWLALCILKPRLWKREREREWVCMYNGNPDGDFACEIWESLNKSSS